MVEENGEWYHDMIVLILPQHSAVLKAIISRDSCDKRLQFCSENNWMSFLILLIVMDGFM
jgi:hypothetical protein